MFSKIGDLWMSGVHRTRTLQEALESVMALLDSYDPLREQQIENSNMVLDELDVSTKIIDDIVTEFESGNLK